MSFLHHRVDYGKLPQRVHDFVCLCVKELTCKVSDQSLTAIHRDELLYLEQALGRYFPSSQLARSDVPGSDSAASQILFHDAIIALRHTLKMDLPDRLLSHHLEIEEG
jgi:hypothetical protein